MDFIKELEKEQHQLEFAAGSIETLKKIIELNKGITILPKLALKDMITRIEDRLTPDIIA